jgi:hypothetical protein
VKKEDGFNGSAVSRTTFFSVKLMKIISETISIFTVIIYNNNNHNDNNDNNNNMNNNNKNKNNNNNNNNDNDDNIYLIGLKQKFNNY